MSKKKTQGIVYTEKTRGELQSNIHYNYKESGKPVEHYNPENIAIEKIKPFGRGFSLKCEDIEKAGYTHMVGRDCKIVLPLSEFRIRKGFEYMSFCKNVEREKTKKYKKKYTKDIKIKDSDKKNNDFNEIDIHPFVAYVSKKEFGYYTKTINSSKSLKAKKGEHMWKHPDMVGCRYLTEYWTEDVIKWKQLNGENITETISFEIKKELTFDNVFRNFSQAKKNSKWANEGYLVCAKMPDDTNFLDMVKEHSSELKIGLILINLGNPYDYKIVVPAIKKDKMNYEFINKMSTANSDFKDFTKHVVETAITQNPKYREQIYDLILTEEELIKNNIS